MQIKHYETLASTHTFLKDEISKNGYEKPICIVTRNQTAGVGSRGNSWVGKNGNLFFSFVLSLNDLSSDLQIQSASIYFSFILKKVLQKYGSKVWIKWPNDFYLDDYKIGGTITSLKKDLLFCGIGLNLKNVTEEFKGLDIEVDDAVLLDEYFQNIEKKTSWKDILKEYMVEFGNSKKQYATINGEKILLSNAQINSDGSININGKKVYSLR